MAEFKQVGRIQASVTRGVVVSKVVENGEVKGININSYVTTDSYTGFTKGTFIPVDSIADFKALMESV